MKKTYMTPAISVMAMETAEMSAGSINSVPKRDLTSDFGIADPTVSPSGNQFSKEHNDVWDED